MRDLLKTLSVSLSQVLGAHLGALPGIVFLGLGFCDLRQSNRITQDDAGGGTSPGAPAV